MKILHTSDWHLGKSLKGINLLDFQKVVLEQIADILSRETPEVFILAGDVYDSIAPSKKAIELFSDFIANISKNVGNIIVISGNHDNEKIVANYNKMLRKNNCFIFDTINPETYNRLKIEDVYFYPIPFIPERDLSLLIGEEENPYEELITRIRSQHSENDKVILIAHLGVFVSEQQKSWLEDSNAEERRNVPLLEASVFQDFYYVALGHFHNYNELKPNIVYPSSLLKFRASEKDHRKGVVLIDTSEKEVMKKFIPFDLPADIMEFYVELDDKNNIAKIEPDRIPDKIIFGIFRVKNLRENAPIRELIERRLGENIRFLEITNSEANRIYDEKGFEVESLQDLNIKNEMFDFIKSQIEEDKFPEYKEIMDEIFNELEL